MFKQFLIVSLLLVALASADPIAPIEEVKPESPLSKLHTSLFNVQADAQGVAETLEQLKSAKSLVESGEDAEGLFSEAPYRPDQLIELYSTEETCNPERAHEISQVQDYHRGKHGVSNVVEYLNFARRYQLAGCMVDEIQGKLAKTVGEMPNGLKLELPSVEYFTKVMSSSQLEKVKTFDKLPLDEVADLVVAYMNESRKGPKFAAATRIIYKDRLQQTARSTVGLLRWFDQAIQANFGLFNELSKDSFVWQKLGVSEKSLILVARLCQVVGNADFDELVKQVADKL